MEFKIINPATGEDKTYSHQTIANFLFTHLEEYGDKVEDILKCIDYAMNPAKGGNIIVGLDNEKIVGVVILNNTGMKDFIPENILVYIAVDNSQRGKGFGKKLFLKCLEKGKNQGFKKAYLETIPILKEAIHIYESNGFKHLNGPLGSTGHFNCGIWMEKQL